MKTTALVLLWQLVLVTAFAQRSDSTHFRKDLYIRDATLSLSTKHQWIRATRVPVALTALSLLSYTDNETLDRVEFKELRDRTIPTYRHRIDNYLQYAPMAAVYGLNLAGIKGKNDFANRTALMVKSGLLVAAMTFPLKKITAVPRPDTGERNSFPSGHTATAFAAATFMAKEYGHISKWYSIGAYSVATGVGVMRMMNNRHWVSDVLAGAAVGILSTNVVYLTHQYKWGRHKHGHSQTLVVPSYDGKTGMLSVVHVLH
jgi:membrane-associated phospholipid phosphatase